MRRALFPLIASLALAAPVRAEDEERGRLLYETHCGECHYERVHQRRNPSVKSMAELRDMVARRASLTRHRFTLEDLEAVTQYLDRSHYRFGTK